MSTAQHRKRLLIVEDDAILRQGLAVLLGNEGYEVALAVHGREALDYLRDNPAPDLILLDMLMPGLDGWHFLEELKRADGPAAAVPVVITTGANLTREWALDHGCAGFISKPMEWDDLLAEIRRCLG